MEPLLLTNIERFSIRKYQEYQRNGMPVRLITGSGTEVHIVASNCGVNKDLFLVETEVKHRSYSDKPYVEWWPINRNGKSTCGGGYHTDVYIQTGAIDIRSGDMFIYCYRHSEGFLYMAMFDRITCLDGKGMPGICEQWSMDQYGTQFCQAGTFIDLDRSINEHKFFMRKATRQEEMQYWKFVEDNGLRLDEKQNRLVCYPKIGQPYWTVEMENGELVVVEHAAPKTQEERPIHSMCFDSDSRAKTYAKNIKDKIFD